MAPAASGTKPDPIPFAGLVVCFVSQSIFMWVKPYRDPSDNTLQLLCQVGIFFALLSKIILDHPSVKDRQSGALGVMLVVMCFVPLLVTLLHAIFDPSDEVVDAFDDPILAMLPGAARVKRGLQKSQANRSQSEPSTTEDGLPAVRLASGRFIMRMFAWRRTPSEKLGPPAFVSQTKDHAPKERKPVLPKRQLSHKDASHEDLGMTSSIKDSPGRMSIRVSMRLDDSARPSTEILEAIETDDSALGEGNLSEAGDVQQMAGAAMGDGTSDMRKDASQKGRGGGSERRSAEGIHLSDVSIDEAAPSAAAADLNC